MLNSHEHTQPTTVLYLFNRRVSGHQSDRYYPKDAHKDSNKLSIIPFPYK